MHWTAAEPGQLDAERGLTLVEQTPGEVIFLSAADTDLYSVASIWTELLGSRLRVANAFPLRQPVAADHYIDNVIKRAKLVVARLLGGKTYFAHFIPDVEFRSKRLTPEPAQIEHAATLASNWARLRTVPNREKKIAIVLSNYPNRDGRIGNGVGRPPNSSLVQGPLVPPGAAQLTGLRHLFAQ